jgi:hypothetical protein
MTNELSFLKKEHGKHCWYVLFDGTFAGYVQQTKAGDWICKFDARKFAYKHSLCIPGQYLHSSGRTSGLNIAHKFYECMSEITENIRHIQESRDIMHSWH